MYRTFDDFFERATGNEPYPYQRHFATGPDLPQLLRAPTGSGKTATAVLGWLWRRLYTDEGVRAATPRRLVFCLPMRSLVTQTEGEVRTWLERLHLDDRVAVHSLMGGAVEQSWEDRPDGEAILIGTQDQLLSRALNRGYAMSRYKWSVHYALLNNDALWVMDEVQLMGVGLSTSAQLQGVAFESYGGRHTVWMSATLDERLLRTVDHQAKGLSTLGLGPEDMKTTHLSKLRAASKRVCVGPVVFQKKALDYAKQLAPEVLVAHDAGGGRTLVIMNRVDRAVELTKALRKLSGAPEVLVLHSRFRPVDRRAIEERALTKDFKGIVVATQAIEAGVNISSRTLFTELAPWSSLVQRFGRCNRYAEHEEGADIHWLDLPIDEEDAALPYDLAELAHARSLLENLDDARIDALPQGRREDVEPTGPVIRRRDLLDLFDTTPDLSGFDLDVSRYIRDAGTPDVQVAWRSWDGVGKEPAPTGDATRTLHRNELCRVPIGAFKKLTEGGAWWVWDPVNKSGKRGRGGRWVRGTRPVPGSMVLVALDLGGYRDSAEAPHEALGLTLSRKDHPQEVSLVEAPNLGEAPDDEDDSLSETVMVRLADHSRDVRAEAEALCQSLSDLDAGLPWKEVVEAAHWHDLGKVHLAWQGMITSKSDSFPEGLGPWAKRPKKERRPEKNRRAFFRHELASALAYLQHDEPSDLVAFLIVAHHGKVRTAIRSRPGERPDAEEVRRLGLGAEPRLALGVYDGEVLPATNLGDGLETSEVRLDLSIMALGDADGPSWVARVDGLLKTFGPYRLALLESLVRVADWRASANPVHTTSIEVTDA